MAGSNIELLLHIVRCIHFIRAIRSLVEQANVQNSFLVQTTNGANETRTMSLFEELLCEHDSFTLSQTDGPHIRKGA